jgi:hypothetical protein
MSAVVQAPDGVAGPGEEGREQGYLCAARRPACGNCWAGGNGNDSGAAQVCGYGGFAVQPDGWCPVWIPSTGWIDKHRHAAKQLGLGIGRGRGPVTAQEKPDADEEVPA